MKESTILATIRNTLGRRTDVRCWRNNVGTLRDERGQYVQYGLCVGSSDLIGYTSVVVTPEMVGRKVAIFTAIEAKGDKGRVFEAQQNFINVVRAAGGYAGVALNVEQAEAIANGL